MSLLRRLHLGLALLLALLPAMAAAETLHLCYEHKDARPWRTAEGNGLDFVLLRTVGEKLGIQMDFQALPWKRCMARLQTSEVDGVFSAAWLPSRAQLGVYPGGAKPDENKRMHTAAYVIVRKKGSPVSWDGKTLSNVNGPIGYQLGYSVGEHLQALKIPVEELNLPAPDLVRRVLSGRLAAAAVFGTDLESLMNGPLADQFDVLKPAFELKPYYLILSHAFVKAHGERAEQIWNAVEAVRNSPEFAKQRGKLPGED